MRKINSKFDQDTVGLRLWNKFDESAVLNSINLNFTFALRMTIE